MIFKKLLGICLILFVILTAGCKKDDFVEPDGVCPVVISTIPINGATEVPLNQIISVTFNEEMNPLTISQASFTIHGASQVQGSITYQGTTATFTPSSPLIPNTSYTGKVKTSVKDKTGNALQADYIWTFSTGAVISPMVILTDPTHNEINVNLNKVVMATFNMPMDPTTINSSTFTISQGGNNIIGNISYTGTTASFTPSANLKSNTIYTATITTGAKNPAGTPLVTNYVWIFTTGSTMAPMVISTDPTNNEVNVILNKIVTATFSEPMNPATITEASFTIRQGTTLVKGTVTYSGTTATFTPEQPFLPGTLYTGTIFKTVKNLLGVSITEDYIWTFTTENKIPPTVIVTDPLNNAINVSLDKEITATFSVAMNPATINGSTFTLYNGSNQINGTVTYSGTIANFKPASNLSGNTTYTATITTEVTNTGGTHMAANYVWTFSTGTIIAPTVISTDPFNNETNVVLNKTITATFSTVMDLSTINGTTFTLYRGVTPVTGIVTYAGTTASFNPTNNLVAGAIYTATITNGAKNVAGTPMAENYIWSFTTEIASPPTVISTDPANNANNVLIDKIITATFSTAMDPTTINGLTFTLHRGATPVTGVITYVGTTASFNPTNNLVAGAIYTATITTGVKNMAGTSLVENYVWSFTTEIANPPTVISTDPANNANNVSLNKIISAVFSEPMDQSTINGLTFTLYLGNTQVTGLVTYSNSTAYFTPNENLMSGNTYTARITTGAKNQAGTPLTNDYVWNFMTRDPLGPAVVDLGSVARFGIIAGVGVSNNAGFSQIRNMDVGISPGVRSSVTGFPPAIIVNGAIYASDDIAPPGIAAMLTQAKQDLTDAYNFAANTTTPAPILVSGDIGGTTLAPGVYKTNSTLLIQSGDLTLDAQGDANAVWIFQIASGFTTIGGAGGNVILSGGAQAKNVFWQTGSSATIGDFTAFKGNILALTSVTMNSGATAEGRMLCINGAVVMTNTNIINKP